MKTVAILNKEDLTDDGQVVHEKDHNSLNHTHLMEWSLLNKYDRVLVRKGNAFIVIGDFGGPRQLSAGTVIGHIGENLF